MGMLQWIKAGALRYGCCCLHSEDANAEGRSDGVLMYGYVRGPSAIALGGIENGTAQACPKIY